MLAIIPLLAVILILAWMLRPLRGSSKSQKTAIFLVSVISLALGMAAIIFQLMQNTTGTIEVSNVSNNFFLAGLAVIGAALLALLGFALVRRGDIIKGLGFGICLAIVISVVEFGMLEWLAGV